MQKTLILLESAVFYRRSYLSKTFSEFLKLESALPI